MKFKIWVPLWASLCGNEVHWRKGGCSGSVWRGSISHWKSISNVLTKKVQRYRPNLTMLLKYLPLLRIDNILAPSFINLMRIIESQINSRPCQNSWFIYHLYMPPSSLLPWNPSHTLLTLFQIYGSLWVSSPLLLMLLSCILQVSCLSPLTLHRNIAILGAVASYFFMWTLGVKLRLSGLLNKHLIPTESCFSPQSPFFKLSSHGHTSPPISLRNHCYWKSSHHTPLTK